MRSYWTSYIEHCWRTWFKLHGEISSTMSSCDRQNMEACGSIWNSLSEQQKRILQTAYSGGLHGSEVRFTREADAFGMRESTCWKEIHTINRTLAVRRGLLSEKN